MPSKLRLLPVCVGLALYLGIVAMVYGRLLSGEDGDVWEVACKEGVEVDEGDNCIGCPSGVVGELPVMIISGCAQVVVMTVHVAMLMLFPPNQGGHILLGVVGVLCLAATAVETIYFKPEIDVKCDLGTALFTPRDHVLYSLLIAPCVAGVLTGVVPFFLKGEVEIVQKIPPEEEIVVRVWKERPSIVVGGGSGSGSGSGGNTSPRKVVFLDDANEVLIVVLVGCLVSRQCVVNLAAASDYWEIPFVSQIIESHSRPIPFISPQKKSLVDGIAQAAFAARHPHPLSPQNLTMDPDLPLFDVNPLSTPNQTFVEDVSSSSEKKTRSSSRRRRKKKNK